MSWCCTTSIPSAERSSAALAGRILERQGFTGALAITGELDRALDGADAVLMQIRVGGQAARLHDETIPARAAASARRRPARAGWRRRCARCRSCSRSRGEHASWRRDGAWIIDFTNPVGIVTRALLDDGHRAIGLCNVAINFQRQIAAHLGVAADRVLVDQVGLNHLTWIRAVWLDGRDVLAEVLGELR